VLTRDIRKQTTMSLRPLLLLMCDSDTGEKTDVAVTQPSHLILTLMSDRGQDCE
jgi:hypothetical protein